MHVDRPPFQADVHLLLRVGHAAIRGAADAAVGVFEGDDAGGVGAGPVNAPGGADALDLPPIFSIMVQLELVWCPKL